MKEGNWVVYVLKCSDNTLYTGITNDLPRRIEAHESGKGAKYTRGRGPSELMLRYECDDKSAALKKEREIKLLSRQEKLEFIAAFPLRQEK